MYSKAAGPGPKVFAAAASVGLSWYYFFMRGDRQRGIFVGLWPPTILAFAGYFNQRKMRKQLEMITQPGATLKNAIEAQLGANRPAGAPAATIRDNVFYGG